MNSDEQAFEYVCGTLRSQERQEFEAKLANDDQLRKTVHFWEEQLMSLQPEFETVEQKNDQIDPSVWNNIHSHINRSHTLSSNDSINNTSLTQRFWQWLTPAFAAVALVLAVLAYYPNINDQAPNTDYVAVLTSNDGRALLTALTTQNKQQMWLKWEIDSIKEGASTQLWAISKRDGETRPIAVLENTQTDNVELNEATWRLITDAEYLILTEEELGGSAIDEPSDVLLAKGICVRFSPS